MTGSHGVPSAPAGTAIAGRKQHGPSPFPACLAVVIGASAGGSEVIRQILGKLGPQYPIPLILVQHLHPDDRGLLARNLSQVMALPVTEALDKMPLHPGRVHVAPAGYHLLVERNGRLALSLDAPERYSRPSIDLSFDSAARVFGERLLAILLSGANEDGAAGLKAVRERGGRTLAQDPQTAAFPAMPQAAIDAGAVQHIRSPAQIAEILERVGGEVASVKTA
jgi:two-component system chemotaxis response regulator CheB